MAALQVEGARADAVRALLSAFVDHDLEVLRVQAQRSRADRGAQLHLQKRTGSPHDPNTEDQNKSTEHLQKCQLGCASTDRKRI